MSANMGKGFSSNSALPPPNRLNKSLCDAAGSGLFEVFVVSMRFFLSPFQGV
jgi:hypothetical protein